MQRSGNTVRIGGSESCKNSTSKSILDVLKASSLCFSKIIVHVIAVVKSEVNKRCTNSAKYQYQKYQSQEHGRCDEDLECGRNMH